MTLRERLAALDPGALVERLALDPPHRVLARAIQVARRTGMLRGNGSPLGLAEAALRKGMSVRSMHAIHAATSPGRIALVDAHRRLDYATLNAEIDAIAAALHDDGARRGEPVGPRVKAPTRMRARTRTRVKAPTHTRVKPRTRGKVSTRMRARASSTSPRSASGPGSGASCSCSGPRPRTRRCAFATARPSWSSTS